ncbi:MAG: hypothetical protein ACHQF4_10795, partial [Sphingobacteriales bacterium]
MSAARQSHGGRRPLQVRYYWTPALFAHTAQALGSGPVSAANANVGFCLPKTLWILALNQTHHETSIPITLYFSIFY